MSCAVMPTSRPAIRTPCTCRPNIFTRLGSWDEVIQWNLKAAEAALQHHAGDGQHVWDEFPHAIGYLVYAYLQQGADDAAEQQVERLRSTERLDPTFKTAFHLSAIPARDALQRGAWQEAAGPVPRPYDALDWDRFPWPQAVTWLARGLGAAHLGQLEDGERALDRLGALEHAADQAGEELFTRQIEFCGWPSLLGWLPLKARKSSRSSKYAGCGGA
jgi:hypothetical protein